MASTAYGYDPIKRESERAQQEKLAGNALPAITPSPSTQKTTAATTPATKLTKLEQRELANVYGVSSEPTAFLYRDTFFKTQEDLQKYMSGVRQGSDPIGKEYERKRKEMLAKYPPRPPAAPAVAQPKVNPQIEQVQMSMQQNAKEQNAILSQRSSLANKTDPASVKQRQALDEKLKDLRQRNAQLSERMQGLKVEDNPARAAEERAKGRPSGQTSQADQGQKTEKLTQATEKLTTTMEKVATTQQQSQNAVNVTFTPISVDVKGSIQTANSEVNQKMMDAIKQAVEQLAPGIISKIYGPPRDTARTS